MFMAIAVENAKHPKNKDDYKVWYLELDNQSRVISVGVKTKEELIASLFRSYQKNGTSSWRAFLKGAENSVPIEVYDFISRHDGQNTHFGNLPTLGEFQQTLDALQMDLELKVAS